MILVVFCMMVLLLFSPASNAINISHGQPAPGFSLSSIDGNRISLSEYKGKIVIFIYWRTDHERSLDALKDGAVVLKKFKGKDVQIISAVAESEKIDDVKEILMTNGIEYPVFVDSNRQIYSSYGIRVYPTTVIIDKNGTLAHDIPSHPLTYKRKLEGYVKNLLGEIDENELKEVLSSRKDSKDKASLEALRLYNLALKFTKSGMLDMAIDTAGKSVAAKPDMTKSHILLGFLYLETKEADKALEAFNRAIELDPHSHDALTGKGGALVLKDDTDAAIEILNSAAVANPYPQMTYYELGKAYEAKGDKDKSIEMYKKAIEKIIKKNILPSSVSKCQ